jgi:hypothetical protein
MSGAIRLNRFIPHNTLRRQVALFRGGSQYPPPGSEPIPAPVSRKAATVVARPRQSLPLSSPGHMPPPSKTAWVQVRGGLAGGAPVLPLVPVPPLGAGAAPVLVPDGGVPAAGPCDWPVPGVPAVGGWAGAL